MELRALVTELAEPGRGRASLILDHLHQNLAVWHLEACWPVVEENLRSDEESLLVLLDGLDEVPTSLRQTVVQAVQELAERYPQHRYVVTCRPYAYVGQPWPLRGFTEVTLAPFDQEQIEAFIATWYRELARRQRLTDQEAQDKTIQLQRAVRQGDLWGLARRPLLLTVMTLLHSFRGQLPEDRTELYADAVDLLLRRWEQRVSGEAGLLERLAMPGLKLSDLEAGLYDVAFKAHSAATAESDTAGARRAGSLARGLCPGCRPRRPHPPPGSGHRRRQCPLPRRRRRDGPARGRRLPAGYAGR